MRDHANHMSWEERGVRGLREEMGGKSGKMVDAGWMQGGCFIYHKMVSRQLSGVPSMLPPKEN